MLFNDNNNEEEETPERVNHMWSHEEAAKNINRLHSEHYVCPDRQISWTESDGALQFGAYDMAYLISKLNFRIFLLILQIYMGIQTNCIIWHFFNTLNRIIFVFGVSHEH